jgi:hypothetical protein
MGLKFSANVQILLYGIRTGDHDRTKKIPGGCMGIQNFSLFLLIQDKPLIIYYGFYGEVCELLFLLSGGRALL